MPGSHGQTSINISLHAKISLTTQRVLEILACLLKFKKPCNLSAKAFLPIQVFFINNSILRWCRARYLFRSQIRVT